MSDERLTLKFSLRPPDIERYVKDTTPKPKPQDYDKNSEIEKIKRQLAQLIDRVDALKKA